MSCLSYFFHHPLPNLPYKSYYWFFPHFTKLFILTFYHFIYCVIILYKHQRRTLTNAWGLTFSTIEMHHYNFLHAIHYCDKNIFIRCSNCPLILILQLHLRESCPEVHKYMSCIKLVELKIKYIKYSFCLSAMNANSISLGKYSCKWPRN